jgi:hypothetical protein
MRGGSGLGHGMPCPYWGKGSGGKNGVAMLAKQWGSWCGVLLAQAGMPVLLEDEKNVIARETNVDGGCCVVTRAALRAAPTDWC